MILRITLIILVVHSCSILKPSFTPHKGIADEFKDIVSEFEEKSGKKVTSSMGFSNELKSHGVVGICNYLTNTITISKAFWDISSPIRRKSLILHELGHCVLFRGHTDGLLGGSDCPKSLMHREVVGEFCLSYYWKLYEEELYKD